TAERLELLAVHRRHAVATASRGDVQRHPVDERRDGHHTAADREERAGCVGWGRSSEPRERACEVATGVSGPMGKNDSHDGWSQFPAGTMFTTRRPRRVPNSTLPATSANKVSSPPRPTPVPGWKWVPRWRTMISPAFTSWPP